MENINLSNQRRVDLTAIIDGTVYENLKALGYSTTICTRLRKQMGLVCLTQSENLVGIILTYKLQIGQPFCIFLGDNIVREIPTFDLPIDIVYEDIDLAVINKPSGIAVISSHGHYGRSLENALANIWGSNFVYRPVNRLDRDTSGLMIVAKNQACHSKLSLHKINREYIALASGHVEYNGIIDAPIALKSDESMIRIISSIGKTAQTIITPIAYYEQHNYTLVKCKLLTGRTHQIRVHLAHLGHSLCCDKLYNTNTLPIVAPNGNTLDRQALHSYKLNFVHPMNNKNITLYAKCNFCNIYELGHDK